MSDIDSQEENDEDWADTNWADPYDNSPKKNKMDAIGSVMNVTRIEKMNMQPIQENQLDDNQNLSESDNKAGENSGLMNRMRLNDNKAGMDGLDKKKINQVILEASKGSRFYENERKKEQQMNKRIEEQKIKLQQITESQLKQGIIEADKLLEEFENTRDISKTIVHIDMDAFYAAVEMKDNPALKDKPMAVGGNSMLSTSNYHARKYGVRAAMPGFIGKKLCPELIIVPTHFDRYTEISKQVREVLAEYDPNFSPMSLDEAYLDMTEHFEKRFHLSEYERTVVCRKTDGCSKTECNCDLNLKLKPLLLYHELSRHNSSPSTNTAVKTDHNSEKLSTTICPLCGKPYPDYHLVTFGMSPDDSVNEMRAKIEQKTGLTASAGIAPNTMLAKVCSDKNKPNGQYRILPDRDTVMEFITDLPTRKISGIGKVSETMLNALGVYTCKDLYEQRALLYHLYSPISFNYFMRICLGIGSTFVERDSERKSISTERTFNEISKPVELYAKCEELSEALSEDLKDEELKGKTVSIKIKTVEFEVKTRAHTLKDYTSDSDLIYAAAKELLRVEIQAVAPNPLRLRLMGVRMSSLLHQNLCKKKQNTITGFIKRMGAVKQKQQEYSDSAMSESESESKNAESTVYQEQTLKKSHVCMVTEQNLERSHDCFSTGVKNVEIPVKDESSDGEQNDERHVDFDISMIKCTNEKVSDVIKRDAMPHQTKSHREDIKLQETSILIQGIREDIANVKEKELKNSIGESKDLSNESCNNQDCTISTNTALDSYVCPVCQDCIECKDLTMFNQHIDVCLNKKVVKDYSKIANDEDRSFKKFFSPKKKSKSLPKAKAKKNTVQFTPISSSLVSQFCKQNIEKSYETSKEEKELKNSEGLIVDIDSDSESNSEKSISVKKSKTVSVSNKTKGKQLKKDSTPSRTGSPNKENKGKSSEINQSLSIQGSFQDCCDGPYLPSGDADSMLSVKLSNSKSTNDEMENLNSSKYLICPVCFMEQKGSDLDIFNEHVDTCLSKDEISKIVKSENSVLSKPQKSEKKIMSKPQKRTLDSPSGKQGNKRQRTKNDIRTIESFFKS
ncbi:DNA polymerase kappa-like [Mytilus californianus]|uniref:DNA polymerase kappa-like n=1 Tax=Mytilus californianus TaxID=6549 RepID=UPI0022459B9D|nr:DNA polymerase kappa-like [Mytilus californianus]